jgi:hypothetical protein
MRHRRTNLSSMRPALEYWQGPCSTVSTKQKEKKHKRPLTPLRSHVVLASTLLLCPAVYALSSKRKRTSLSMLFAQKIKIKNRIHSSKQIADRRRWRQCKFSEHPLPRLSNLFRGEKRSRDLTDLTTVSLTHADKEFPTPIQPGKSRK